MPSFLPRFYFLPADIPSYHSLQMKYNSSFKHGGSYQHHNREAFKRRVQIDNFILKFIRIRIASFPLVFIPKHCDDI